MLRSDAKPLTDDEWLAKLRSFDMELDRPWLERYCREALSAEEMATPLLDQRTFPGRQAEMESDWIWVCLTTLWQRWFPDQPCFELLDDKIEAGYDLQGSAACRIWLEAWKDVLGLLDKGGLTSIRAFDERFRGSQSLFNWMQDLEDALWNAGLEDRQSGGIATTTESIVQGFIIDTGFLQLALGPLVAIQPQADGPGCISVGLPERCAPF